MRNVRVVTPIIRACGARAGKRMREETPRRSFDGKSARKNPSQEEVNTTMNRNVGGAGKKRRSTGSYRRADVTQFPIRRATGSKDVHPRRRVRRRAAVVPVPSRRRASNPFGLPGGAHSQDGARMTIAAGRNRALL